MDGGIDKNSMSDSNIVVQQPIAAPNTVNPASTAIPPQGPEGSITWTASEFVAHKKGPLWYLVVILAAVLLSGLIFLLTKDKVSSSAIIVVAVVLIFFGAKRPRELDYRIDKDGLHIGGRDYVYDQFRSFSIVQKGAFSSLIFYPLKRFSLLTTAYYNPLDEKKILAIVSSYLPLEEKSRDLIDDLMWKIRF